MNSAAKSPRFVFVLGMHRGGTSSITRGLQVLGVDLGSNLMPAVSGVNDKGFFEDLEIYDFHNDFLRVLGQEWHTLAPVIPVGFAASAAARDFHARAVKILHDKSEGKNVIAVKDPRLARFLPFWQQVVAQTRGSLSYVIPYRNPLAVAHSLAKRDGFDREKSYKLWIEHMMLSLQNTGGAPRVVVDYDRMIEEPAAQLRRIARALDLKFDASSTQLKTYQNQFLDTSLRHARPGAGDLARDPAASPQLRKFNELLVDLARDHIGFDDPGLKKLLAETADPLHVMHEWSRLVEVDDNSQPGRSDGAAPFAAGPVLSEKVSVGSFIRSACFLWTTQIRISGGIWPALRYSVKRVGNLGWGRMSRMIVANTRSLEADPHDQPLVRCIGQHGWHGFEPPSNVLNRIPPIPYIGRPPVIDLGSAYITRLDRLVFRNQPKPLVSIIIPFHNQVKYTAECLVALSDSITDDLPYEIVLVDDASNEPGFEKLARIGNISFIRLDRNAGFLGACNLAAARAKGDFLLFLNNDTQVQRGAVRALIDVFSTSPDAGAAGPKVLYPHGCLQDAGGILRGDFSVEMVGKGDHPGKPFYNIRRPVDFCSGVCLLVRRELFHRLGGFSADLAPAYYEDVDLCLKIRSEGLKIYYEPRAVVLHPLCASIAATDESRKMDMIFRNRQRMIEKWQDVRDAAAQIRLIAFYLPQYHPIPENDRWWGPGFTEWDNVRAAKPVFEGHVQPRLPGALGYYDLRQPETMDQQAELARRYGLHGFCYYYYWFGGKRLLDMPIERMLSTGQPDFPFCLCWANENWTRRWDGKESEVLISQSYSEDDDLAVIADLIRYMRDRRYIRINGRPLLLVYRTSLLPDVRKTSERWRQACRDAGVGEIMLAAVESFDFDWRIDPERYGFDFTVAFPPHGTPYKNTMHGLHLHRNALVYHYRDMLRYAVEQEPVHLKRFLAVAPGWDNTPRRKTGSTIFVRSTPAEFQQWLEWTFEQTCRCHQDDRRLVFINAWNEWAEGAVLEPDQQHGTAYLEAVRNALLNVKLNSAT